MKNITFLLLAFFVYQCDISDELIRPPLVENDLYFPPIHESSWDTTTIRGWEEEPTEDLYDFLSTNNTRAFILLKDGKIVAEKYWGKKILSNQNFDRESKWYWASAGKTITSLLVGIAQENGDLDIENKTSDYLGEGWTSLSAQKENLITVRHQLTMTTGLDYRVEDWTCTTPSCLTYKTDAGEEWYYYNAPYTLLQDVISNATNTDFNLYTDEKLEMKIGMNGDWRKSGNNSLYWSTARDAARFGLLILNEGKWEEEPVLGDLKYYNDMVSSSQDLNPSYGYLWWLNGKDKIIMPSLPNTFNTSLSPNAPKDLFAAMGKNGQFIDVVPSENIVVVRMGEAPNDQFVPAEFHDEMWEKISALLEN